MVSQELMATGQKNLARWYREVAQHLAAGLPLTRAVVNAGGPARKERKRMEQELTAGRSWSDVLNSARWLPPEDRALLVAAAESGRLVEVLMPLARKRALLAEQNRRAVGACVYPVAVLHFGALAVPLRFLVMGETETYLAQAGTVLIPLWLVIGVLAWGAGGRHAWLQMLMRMVPFFRAYSRRRALADLAFTLEGGVIAGQSIVRAWESAGAASGDGRLQRAADRIAAAAREGNEPGATLSDENAFPDDFVSLYLTGEKTGQLDENLGHLAHLYGEQASDSLRAASAFYPKILFLLVAVWVAYTVLSFYAGYFGQFEELLQF